MQGRIHYGDHLSMNEFATNAMSYDQIHKYNIFFLSIFFLFVVISNMIWTHNIKVAIVSTFPH